jgi:hypothetical protein
VALCLGVSRAVSAVLQGAGPGLRLWARPDPQARLATWLEEWPAAHGWTDDQVWTPARVRRLIGRRTVT